MSPAQIDQAVDGYLAIGGFLTTAKQQTALDLQALGPSGRGLSPAERERFMAAQHAGEPMDYRGPE